MLEQETIINLTTPARVRLLHMGTTQPDTLDDARLKQIIRMLSQDAMVNVMCRAIQYKSRDEYLDIHANQRDFYVEAPPILIDNGVSTDITIVHNVDQPRVWTDSGDEVDSDYIICNDDMAKEGKIHIEQDYDAAVQALKITYTGGLGTETCPSGTDGATSDPGDSANNKFTSASATFSDDGVAVGDYLIIRDGTNAQGSTNGLYEITTVTDNNNLLVSPAFETVPATSQKWEHWSKGIVYDWPDIAMAVEMQTAYMWQNRMNWGIAGGGIVGASFTYTRPFDWLKLPRKILNGYKRKRAFA